MTYDIPAGPKSGPLEQPSPEPSESAAPATSSSSDDGMGWMYVFGPPLVLFVVLFLALVLLAVLVIVLVSRRGRKNEGGHTPVGAGWGAQFVLQQPGPPPNQFVGPYGQPAQPPYQGQPQAYPGQFGPPQQSQQPPANGPVPPPPSGPPPGA